ncbi:MAG: ankyrin repeat domain-containing protein, partial [Pelagibacterales bacterium]|nr:ankyrin repeat domain-containing protein [Pelagibacterales bacterium]
SGKSGILYAAGKGYLETLKVLIDAGVDVNRLDANKLTPLMWASAYGHKDVVLYLLSKNAKIENKDNQGKTAIDYALENNHKEVYEILKKL